jgi:hypothetical protein
LLIDRRAAAIPCFLFSIFVFSFLAGCGAPGEPTERKAPTPVAVTDLAASQQGNDVVLTFTLPKESVEHKPLKHPPAVEIFRTIEPKPLSQNAPAPSDFIENATPVATIPPEMVGSLVNRNQFRFVDTLTADDFSRGQAVYIVRTRTSPKKVSADSNAAPVAIHPAPDAISDLQAEVTRQAIVLTWTPPQKTLTGSAPPISSYSIYRAESDLAPSASTSSTTALAGTEQKNPFAHVGDTPSPPFRDPQVQIGKKYTYSVRSIAQYDDARVQSADSNFASVDRLDSFPPSAPEGLVAVLVPAQGQSPASFDLSWSISPDNDIAGYNIYRREGEVTSRTKLNPTLLLTPAFRDMNVFPERHYLYTVTAVDRAGNESPESAPISGDVPESGTPETKQPE